MAATSRGRASRTSTSCDQAGRSATLRTNVYAPGSVCPAIPKGKTDSQRGALLEHGNGAWRTLASRVERNHLESMRSRCDRHAHREAVAGRIDRWWCNFKDDAIVDQNPIAAGPDFRRIPCEFDRPSDAAFILGGGPMVRLSRLVGSACCERSECHKGTSVDRDSANRPHVDRILSQSTLEVGQTHLLQSSKPFCRNVKRTKGGALYPEFRITFRERIFR